MAKVFNQKIKILYLMQMMWEQTDENHVLSMQQILSMLEELGIRAERKSIYDDFEVLRNFGMDVRFRKSQPSGYYLTNRVFDENDIRYLMKLILLDEGKTEQSEVLIEKLKKQLSMHQKDITADADQKEEPVQETKAEALKEVSAETKTVQEEVVFLPEEDENKKEIQLLFKGKHMDAVMAHKDRIEDAKEHKSGVYKIKMKTVVDEKFYAWMVSLGFGIKIVKPKAEAEAYRLHLKKLLKQYK